ncbi:hypothetical protein GMRT_12600 [Giardia muris]|uniref:Uncharacterized protein n=1 Tax=Giardia muris TaxID=5742 RepID=A0A4Z1SY84_GIAMU|nr:hypothetical protein GMRT_12600 [Giardia muris]|eukprot:TNJ28468.1 hypothetical protein GMRT_12600 [Giardia muris]
MIRCVALCDDLLSTAGMQDAQGLLNGGPLQVARYICASDAPSTAVYITDLSSDHSSIRTLARSRTILTLTALRMLLFPHERDISPHNFNVPQRVGYHTSLVLQDYQVLITGFFGRRAEVRTCMQTQVLQMAGTIINEPRLHELLSRLTKENILIVVPDSETALTFLMGALRSIHNGTPIQGKRLSFEDLATLSQRFLTPETLTNLTKYSLRQVSQISLFPFLSGVPIYSPDLPQERIRMLLSLLGSSLEGKKRISKASHIYTSNPEDYRIHDFIAVPKLCGLVNALGQEGVKILLEQSALLDISTIAGPQTTELLPSVQFSTLLTTRAASTRRDPNSSLLTYGLSGPFLKPIFILSNSLIEALVAKTVGYDLYRMYGRVIWAKEDDPWQGVYLSATIVTKSLQYLVSLAHPRAIYLSFIIPDGCDLSNTPLMRLNEAAEEYFFTGNASSEIATTRLYKELHHLLYMVGHDARRPPVCGPCETVEQSLEYAFALISCIPSLTLGAFLQVVQFVPFKALPYLYEAIRSRLFILIDPSLISNPLETVSRTISAPLETTSERVIITRMKDDETVIQKLSRALTQEFDKMRAYKRAVDLYQFIPDVEPIIQTPENVFDSPETCLMTEMAEMTDRTPISLTPHFRSMFWLQLLYEDCCLRIADSMARALLEKDKVTPCLTPQCFYGTPCLKCPICNRDFPTKTISFLDGACLRAHTLLDMYSADTCKFLNGKQGAVGYRPIFASIHDPSRLIGIVRNVDEEKDQCTILGSGARKTGHLVVPEAYQATIGRRVSTALIYTLYFIPREYVPNLQGVLPQHKPEVFELMQDDIFEFETFVSSYITRQGNVSWAYSDARESLSFARQKRLARPLMEIDARRPDMNAVNQADQNDRNGQQSGSLSAEETVSRHVVYQFTELSENPSDPRFKYRPLQVSRVKK